MEYRSVAQTAAAWGVSERTVRSYCAAGKIPGAFLAAIVICVVFVIVLGLYPQLIFDYCETAAHALLG